MRQLAVANGPNIFQMLLVYIMYYDLYLYEGMAKAAKSENIKVAVRVRPFISFIAALKYSNSNGELFVESV